jgi:hypothetical protein
LKIQHKEDYRVLRSKKYPNIGNQLDAILKLTISLKEQGFTIPLETQDWLNQCLLIKSTYKKD